MDGGITMETSMTGGFMKGLGRVTSSESLFLSSFTAAEPDQEIVLASAFPGCIVAVEMDDKAIIAQKSAFLGAQPEVALNPYAARGIGTSLPGGEGFILQRISGKGTVLLEIDGNLVERTLGEGESIKVDTGNVAAFEETVVFQAEVVKGLKNALSGGEGLFLATLTGPGTVWLQTMALPEFARNLLPYLPRQGSR
jgi:uncharacterized protein (TIGR00266 family)